MSQSLGGEARRTDARVLGSRWVSKNASVRCFASSGLCVCAFTTRTRTPSRLRLSFGGSPVGLMSAEFSASPLRATWANFDAARFPYSPLVILHSYSPRAGAGDLARVLIAAQVLGFIMALRWERTRPSSRCCGVCGGLGAQGLHFCPTSCATQLCNRSMWFYFRPH